MNWPRIARISAYVLGGCVLAGVVAVTSFCVAFRAERRSNIVQVPDWSGHKREDAEADARRLGLAFEIAEERHDAGVAASRVLQQEPAPGTTVRRGRTIRVVVSLGGETLAVPDIVREPARQADLELRRIGLETGWDARVHDDDVPDGYVIAQAPAPGTLSVAGERVHRLVSDGPRAQRYVMADLSGRTLREVEDWITLCGFRTGSIRRIPAEGRPTGTVVGQLPPAGWPIGRRDVVELTIAQ